ncbi:amino acid adenylation domain-containing protein [Actinocrispum sp. NPDC049592]|uniref:amino acid adenylation domain-containing protein n=1 Tax=Actinocrispum sp. NPDC049592 TaxID=3154835 RepID=UPI0034156849
MAPTMMALTASQRDIWAAGAHRPDSPQHTSVAVDRLTGDVDVDLLAACLARALRHNDALRLRFDERDGVPYQWLHPDPVAAPVVELAGRAECDTWIEDLFNRPFPLRRSPMVHAALLKEGSAAVRLCVAAHHIVADGWALHEIVVQVVADYDHVKRTGKPPEPGPPSFLSFVEREAAYLASPAFENDRDFHREALAGVSPALFPRRTGIRQVGRHRFVLPEDLVGRMREAGHSPFMVVTAAFATYLARVHGSDEVVLGIPALNRRTLTEKRTVGQFASTMPLRVPVSGEQSLRDLATTVRTRTYALKRRERLSLGDILRALPADDAGPRRLFDVTVSYMHYPRRSPVPGLSRDMVGLGHAHDGDALAVVLTEFDDTGHVLVDLEYAADVFDEDFPIEATARHVLALLDNGLTDPQPPVSAIPMLSPGEHARLVAAPSPAVRSGTVHGLFEEQVQRTPDRVALVSSDGSSTTYAELDARAEVVARELRGEGVGRDDRVAVQLDRGPALIVTLLGVLKAGGAYVPLDPAHPAERSRFVRTDSGAKVLITGSERTRFTGDPADAIADEDSLAYVIYTSGSTGQPKGVMVEHRSVVNRLAWMQDRYPLDDTDVLMQKTPVTFDVSVWELFWWALGGARLALLPPGAEKDPRRVLEFIAQHGVTVVHFVPSMLGPFLDEWERRPELGRSLRRVFCSGEALPPDLVARFGRIAGGTRLVNLYGPTEATVDVSFFDCPADPVDRIPIGRAIDGIRLAVLDQYGKPQPVGAPGELCISGVGVARGYLNRPELQAGKFAADPFTPGERMYRTGDIARWLASGDLEYLGRADDQVKIRGNRVEPGEIRACLLTFPGVREAVVVHTRGRLVAYVVAADADVDALRLHLADRLPEYMVPALFVPVERIPLTPNGKLDVRALPAAKAAQENTAPRTEVEAALAAVWSEVLDVSPVGVHDNWFTLGGDSILVLRLRALAAQRGIHFELTDVAAHPSVAALASRVYAEQPDTPGPAPFDLVPAVDRARLADAVDAYPASALQLGLLYHSRTHENTAMYHDVFRYTLAIGWQEVEFRRAFDLLAERHPVLRSSFDLARSSQPLQVVHRNVHNGLEVVDLRALDGAQAEVEVRKHIEDRRSHDYELDRPPLYLLRVHVLADRVDLVFSFHHAILDGWSVATLLRELLQDYLHALGADIEPVVAGPASSAAQHVLDERSALNSPEAAQHWREVLTGSSPAQLTAFRPHEPPGDGELLVRLVELPHAEKVRDFAHRNGIPVKSVLLAAHCLALRMFCDGPVITGLVTHGRPDDRVAGLFLNTVPVRVDSTPRTWADAVREIQRQERDGYPHRRYPLSAIQRDHGGPVLETAFNFMHPHVLAPVLTVPGVALLGFQAWEETNFALLLNAIVDPVSSRTWLRIDCAASVFTNDQADLFARCYTGILARIVAAPDDEVDFAFLAADEPGHVVHVFARQAASTPDAVAVTFGPDKWTYRELDLAAGRVARRLVAIGAGRGTRVGVAVDRSFEMIALVLGIARAGAACVPLDPAYPRPRLAAMLERARPAVVVTHARYADLAEDTVDLTTLLHPGDAPESGEVTLDDTAYILFTSGSTGTPNGVVMPHRALANLVAHQNRTASGAAGGTTLQYAPLSFDVSFQEIFSTLCGGGTLTLVSDPDRRDPATVLRLLDGIDRVFLPYVALQQLAEAAGALGLLPRGLRVIISSGEQLRVTDEIRRLCAALPGIVLENQYGPTETHVATSYTMTGDPADFPALPPIGTPIDGLRATVLDSRMRPVPAGTRGEIHLGGAGLATGYDGEPELTARRFVRDPASGEAWYRTGDIGMELPSGDLVYLGRSDSQVKIRGFRVETAEVELAINAPGIREVAVVARDGGRETHLVAFLVGDGTTDLTELRSAMRARLPEYLVPTEFQWLPSLPLTPSGKRDDAALRRIAPACRVTTGSSPRDENERALVEILAELLGLPAVGVHDDFFDIGGTSVTAMRLAVLLEKRYNVHLPLSVLVAAPTAAALATRLRQAASATFDPLVPMRTHGTRPPLFLVHPIGGNVLCYLPLVRNLPADWPCYALQAAGCEPGTEPLRTVPELARSYLDAMRRVQPCGPYTIAGWSFGGIVAFEMARQLHAAGEDIDRLVLLDTIALAPGPRTEVPADVLLEWFGWELLRMRDTTTHIEPLPAGDQLEVIAAKAVEAGVLPPGSSTAVVRRLFRVFQANWTAALAYQPGVIAGDMTLVRATQPLPRLLEPAHDAAGSLYRDPANGWGELTAGHLDVVDVAGDHIEMMAEPHVRTVAAALSELLHRSAR